MGIFGPKPWVNPFEKNAIFFTFWPSCLYSLEMRFCVLEYRKAHFPGLYCVWKEDGKMAIFGPKPWVNPFEKNLTFQI